MPGVGVATSTEIVVGEADIETAVVVTGSIVGKPEDLGLSQPTKESNNIIAIKIATPTAT